MLTDSQHAIQTARPIDHTHGGVAGVWFQTKRLALIQKDNISTHTYTHAYKTHTKKTSPLGDTIQKKPSKNN